MKDFKKAVVKGAELLNGVLAKVGDDSFKVGLSLKFKPEGNRIQVEADISFVESKVKDSAVGYVSDQTEMELK